MNELTVFKRSVHELAVALATALALQSMQRGQIEIQESMDVARKDVAKLLRRTAAVYDPHDKFVRPTKLYTADLEGNFTFRGVRGTEFPPDNTDNARVQRIAELECYIDHLEAML